MSKLSSCLANSSILLGVSSTQFILKCAFSSLNWFSSVLPHLQEAASRNWAGIFPASQAHFWQQCADVIKDAFSQKKEKKWKGKAGGETRKPAWPPSHLFRFLMLWWRCREQSHQHFWQPGHPPNTTNTDAKDKLKLSHKVWDRLYF